jgi:Zn-finger protein
MKKVLVAAGIVSVMASTTAFALTFTGTNVAKAGVVASKHNMNSYTENTKDAEGRVCAFCHTPHHALADNTVDGIATYLPLWSHKLTSQVTYNAYNSATVNVDNGTLGLSGPTILCMSCHDGVVAVDEHYNNGLNTNKLADDGFGGTAIGLKDANGATSLGNDHPIGFMYDDAVQAHLGDLNPKDTVYLGGTKKIEEQLTGGLFTCATCHDVHNKDNVQNTYPGSSRNYFLLGDNNGSQFCLSCHVK